MTTKTAPEKMLVRTIGVSKCHPNRWNRALEDDDPKLKGLAESMQAQGLLQPILVRRDGTGYEILAGERRWRAARLLEWSGIPANVVELDDHAARLATITENLQREDVPPLEQADGVAALLEEHGGDVAEVAARLGYRETWVRDRARLGNLSDAWRRELTDPNGGHAHLAAKISWLGEVAGMDPEIQDRVLESNQLRFARSRTEVVAVLKRMALDLGEAPWAMDWAPDGLPACDACPRRSDRASDLFAALAPSEDCEALCLDRACYRKKTDLLALEAYRQLLARRKKSETALPLAFDYDYGGEWSAIEALADEAGVRALSGVEWAALDVSDGDGADEDWDRTRVLLMTGESAGTVAEVAVWRGDDEDNQDDPETAAAPGVGTVGRLLDDGRRRTLVAYCKSLAQAFRREDGAFGLVDAAPRLAETALIALAAAQAAWEVPPEATNNMDELLEMKLWQLAENALRIAAGQLVEGDLGSDPGEAVYTLTTASTDEVREIEVEAMTERYEVAPDLLEAYRKTCSPDKLAAKSPKIRGTFEHAGIEWVCTSSVSSGEAGIEELYAWRVIPAEAYTGERTGEGIGYEGKRAKHKKQDVVLTYPRAVFTPLKNQEEEA